MQGSRGVQPFVHVREGLKDVSPLVERGTSLLPHRLHSLPEGLLRSLMLRASVCIFRVLLQGVVWPGRLLLPARFLEDVCVCVYVFMYVVVYVFMYVFVYVFVYVFGCVFVGVCVYSYMNVYVFAYVGQ